MSIMLLVALMAADPTPTVAVRPPARERPGLTATVGLGYAYGGLGGQFRFDLPVRPWLELAPFGGAGLLDGSQLKSLSWAGGVSASLGRRHRLTADLAVAAIAGEDLVLHGTVVDSRIIYGPNVGVGYEFFSNFGGLVRLLVGYGWGLWGKGEGPFPSTVTFALGLGGRVR
jgi:hypothetical protein